MKKLLLVVASLVLVAACSPAASGGGGSGTVKVVAGENFWGSIASQLGGSHATVQSVVSDPNADPHEYESSSNDARAFAEADLVLLNGAGYDAWGAKLLGANPSTHRQVVTVADLLGKKEGDNAHFWYGPEYVTRVADKLTAEYKAIDPADSAYFDQRRAAFASAAKPYQDRIAEIKQKFGSTRVGSTESIFEYLATAAGLDLVSPPEFMQAVAEGNDPPAGTVVQFQDQVALKRIKVLVYNLQTVTQVTTNLRHQAQAEDIPVVGISETLQPESATFQDWQLAQLISLQNALASAAGA